MLEGSNKKSEEGGDSEERWDTPWLSPRPLPRLSPPLPLPLLSSPSPLSPPLLWWERLQASPPSPAVSAPLGRFLLVGSICGVVNERNGIVWERHAKTKKTGRVSELSLHLRMKKKPSD